MHVNTRTIRHWQMYCGSVFRVSIYAYTKLIAIWNYPYSSTFQFSYLGVSIDKHSFSVSSEAYTDIHFSTRSSLPSWYGSLSPSRQNSQLLHILSAKKTYFPYLDFPRFWVCYFEWCLQHFYVKTVSVAICSRLNRRLTGLSVDIQCRIQVRCFLWTDMWKKRSVHCYL